MTVFKTRKEDMVALKKSGFSYSAIGRRWGISRERVRQIVMGNPKYKAKPKFSGEAMLTTRDVARLLGCHINTVRRWTNNGYLKSYRVGRDRRFLRKDINKFLTERG